ncbi:MAG: hypothetical protein ABSB59_07450 [Streptosporangiaceae bacterium]|jgi:hypothetical protein
MPESEKQGEVESGIDIHISGSDIVKGVKRSGTWAAKNFAKIILPVAIAGGGIYGGYDYGSSSHATEPTKTTHAITTAAAHSSVTIQTPGPNAPVAQCAAISGVAELQPGDHIWILDQNQGSLEYYLKGTAIVTPTSRVGKVDWSYQSTIGAANEPGQFDIIAIVVDSDTSDFLRGIVAARNLKRVSGGLADTALLTSEAIYRVSVQRVASKNGVCT